MYNIELRTQVSGVGFDITKDDIDEVITKIDKWKKIDRKELV